MDFCFVFIIHHSHLDIIYKELQDFHQLLPQLLPKDNEQ